jgi:hypothetical protein
MLGNGVYIELVCGDFVEEYSPWGEKGEVVSVEEI